jgi:hypothetical protein
MRIVKFVSLNKNVLDNERSIIYIEIENKINLNYFTIIQLFNFCFYYIFDIKLCESI